MKFKPRKSGIVSAIQWKGWPHKIKGLTEHSKYPQMAQFGTWELYPDDWLVTNSIGDQWVANDIEFRQEYKRA